MHAPPDRELTALLSEVNTIAVIGANDRPGRPVNMVGRFLIEAGYTVYPVHPKRQTVWGLDAYPSITELPGPADLIDLFRAAKYCPDHARECLGLDPLPAVFWMQQGILSPEAREILAPTSVAVIEDRCLMVEIRRLLS